MAIIINYICCKVDLQLAFFFWCYVHTTTVIDFDKKYRSIRIEIIMHASRYKKKKMSGCLVNFNFNYVCVYCVNECKLKLIFTLDFRNASFRISLSYFFFLFRSGVFVAAIVLMMHPYDIASDRFSLISDNMNIYWTLMTLWVNACYPSIPINVFKIVTFFSL